MSFIRIQHIAYDEQGKIVRGSACICESTYVRTGKKHHSVQRQVESLGKVVWLSEDRKSGVFLSKTRGLVEYDATTNQFRDVGREDPRVAGLVAFPAPDAHTVFGDVFFLLHFMRESGMSDILSGVFAKGADLQRFLCHSLHSILKEGSRITCDLFVGKSAVSYLSADVPTPSLRTDTAFFTMMGGDGVKTAFFKAFVREMRKTRPAFGRGCYVDSTPLPNDVKDNPFNALCSHGVESTSIQTRLVLVLDEETGLPVWYTLIPGNVLDVNTVRQVADDVEDTLDIRMNSLVLDAGYVTKALVEEYHIGTAKTVLARMPARRGFPYKQLYREVAGMIGNGKYTFIRNTHTYFGHRKKITLFGKEMWAYIYVDKVNAVLNSAKWIMAHRDEYDRMGMAEKTWTEVSFGYFVLLSNAEKTPAETLDDYFGRTSIESVIKTAKEYVNLLPLCKWNATTIGGKILLDIIDLIIYLQLRKRMAGTETSVTEMLGNAQSWMCHLNTKGVVNIETPNKQVREMAKILNVKIPAYMHLSELQKMVFGK